MSSLCRQLERCGFDLDAPKTGRAVNFWLKTDDHQHVDRDHIWSEKPDGLVFVRTRLSKSERERDKVLNGMSRQGHTGIVTYIDTTAREIHCVAGNSSGFGHSRVRGGGQVAREIIREGDDAWARLVGFVRVDPSCLALSLLYPAAIAASVLVIGPFSLPNTKNSANLICISVSLLGSPMVDNLRQHGYKVNI